MANNNKKAASSAVIDKEQRRIDGTKIFLVIFAAIALVGIITAIAFGVAGNISKKPLDYYNMKLNKLERYIKISPEDYKSFDVIVNLDPVTDLAVENEILKLRYSHRKATDGKNKVGQVVKAGDTANIYYYGYTLDENGEKVPFSGGSNFSSSVTSLGIGSGNMIVGFELALVNVNSADYRTMTKRTEGVVDGDNIVTITYDFVSFDGAIEKEVSATIDLSTDVNAKYGEGFKEYLIGKEIGKTIEDPLLIDKVGTDGITRSDTYSNVKIANSIDFSEGETLTIDVTFPRPYSSTDLEGKSVKFDIYIVTSVSYETPDFNDEFITETLKVTAEDLAEYEGETLTEKYTAKIRADLEKTYQDNVNATIEEALWNHYHKVVNVKKLPKSEVNTFYTNYENEINTYYSTYQSYYTSFDQAARDYLQIGSTADWRAALTERAEESVTEKLIFYYIARTENLLPSDEEKAAGYEDMFQEMLDAYLEQNKVNRDDFETEEKYNEEVEKYKSLILANYGEDYIMESVVFEHVMKTLRSYANVIYAD